MHLKRKNKLVMILDMQETMKCINIKSEHNSVPQLPYFCIKVLSWEIQTNIFTYKPKSFSIEYWTHREQNKWYGYEVEWKSHMVISLNMFSSETTKFPYGIP